MLHLQLFYGKVVVVCCIVCEEVILLIIFSYDNFRCIRPQNSVLFNILCDCVVLILLKEECLGLQSLTSQSLCLRSACAMFKAQGSSMALLLCVFDLDLVSPFFSCLSPAQYWLDSCCFSSVWDPLLGGKYRRLSIIF